MTTEVKRLSIRPCRQKLGPEIRAGDTGGVDGGGRKTDQPSRQGRAGQRA